jgi:hypothetical protein
MALVCSVDLKNRMGGDVVKVSSNAANGICCKLRS